MTPTPETPLRCDEHPNVETYLRCGRCERPICPRCLVYTPVGVRCKECAQVRKLPTYDVGGSMYLRAVLAGLGLGLGFGILWGLAWIFGLRAGFFTLWIVIFLGYGVGELIARSVNRKRGPGLMAVAVGSMVLVFLVSRLLPVLLTVLTASGAAISSAFLMRLASAALLDPVGWLLVALGAAIAASRLR